MQDIVFASHHQKDTLFNFLFCVCCVYFWISSRCMNVEAKIFFIFIFPSFSSVRAESMLHIAYSIYYDVPHSDFSLPFKRQNKKTQKANILLPLFFYLLSLIGKFEKLSYRSIIIILRNKNIEGVENINNISIKWKIQLWIK